MFINFSADGTILVPDSVTAELLALTPSGDRHVIASGFVGRSTAPIGPKDVLVIESGELFVSDGASIWYA